MTDVPFTDKPVFGRFTQNYHAQNKSILGAVKDSAKLGVEDIKAGLTQGKRAVAFGRVTGVTAGTAIAGHALFSGKTAEGEDRSLLARLGEFVLGTGVAVGSLVVGKGR
ncbi:MAG: hypothetical protein ACOYNL_01215 [Rickettsiales bacterium]